MQQVSILDRCKRTKRSSNPLVAGIVDFLEDYKIRAPNGGLLAKYEVTDGASFGPIGLDEKRLPKRFTIYEPLLLLNPAFEDDKTDWGSVYHAFGADERTELFDSICHAFRNAGKNVTHVAINAPIEMGLNADIDANDNVMRTPSNLKTLFGNFGPSQLAHTELEQVDVRHFATSLWVETAQVPGVIQVWAPLWTMFSRGNISEKARILGISRLNDRQFPGLRPEELGQDLCEVDVVDMYVGIGYFALPYLKRGVRRVFGWELNSWSVEGLRRGCERNSIPCAVFELGTNANDEKLDHITRQVVTTLQDSPQTRCIAFRGDNQYAAAIMSRIALVSVSQHIPLNVRHCNLGLLPTSEGSYKAALDVGNFQAGFWIHAHENAEITQVGRVRERVVSRFAELGPYRITCEWTEMVKTYAPGVGHFVFDLKATMRS